MKKLIYIKDTDKNNFLIPLKILLDELNLIGNEYIWSILTLEASGNLEGVTSYSKINETIKNFSQGYCMSWSELKILATKFDQVINMLLVASEDKYKDKIQIYNYKNNKILYNSYPVVIEIVDGDFWEVCTSDESLINLIKSKYKNIEIKEI